MLWSITGYPPTIITWPYRGFRCRPIKVKYFFEIILWQVTSFQVIAGSSLFLFLFIWNMLCLCVAQLKVWIQTDRGRYWKFRQLLQAGKTVAFDFSPWSRVGHALRPIFYALIGQNLTEEFMRKINAASWNKLVNFDSWSCQSFVSTCEVFNCLFPLDVQNEIRCYQDSSVIHGWFVHWVFGWEMRHLSKSEPISDGIVFVFHLAWCVSHGLKVPSDSGLNTW